MPVTLSYGLQKNLVTETSSEAIYGMDDELFNQATDTGIFLTSKKSEMGFLDTNLTKDSSLLLHAIHVSSTGEF